MKQFKLYRVQYVNGSSRLIRSTSMQYAGQQATKSDGSDIADIQCLSVDNVTGKQARSLVRMAHPEVSTRHMLAMPARALLRHSLFPQSPARVTKVSDTCVIFKLGGAY